MPSPVVDTAAVNIHTTSHHFYTPQSGWFNTDDDTQFCRLIDRYLTVKTGTASIWGALDYIEEKMEETGAEQYVFNGGTP